MRSVDSLKKFVNRCDDLAKLCSRGTLDLQTAVDSAHDYAVAFGLTESLGQDRVQQIIGEAFRPYREDLP